jgi:RNA polymerase sigma factor (sigma-70 family)
VAGFETPGSAGDAELVAAARAGSMEAFACLADRHRGMVAALARRLLGTDDLVADVTQEATVAALVSLDRLRSPGQFGAWYAGIALNVARRLLREMRPGPLPEDYPDSGPGPAEQAEAADAARRVREAVATLAPGQRAAVLAFYWQGLTHAEAALELGITVGAVKARLHQARGALAPQLAAGTEHEKEVPAMPTAAEPVWVDAEVIDVCRSDGPDDPLYRPHVVVLQERGGTRRLPMYTGPAEAIALACSLESVEMPRPMTYQLAANLLTAAGSRLTEVRVTRLVEGVFYAVVVVAGPDGTVEVDARPSDALNLAVVSGAPVRIDAAVLSDPEATRGTEWEQYPARVPDLAAEALERRASIFARIAQEHESAEQPEP